MKTVSWLCVAGGLTALAALRAAASPAVSAPQDAGEVGIIERLGAQAPLDLVFKDEQGNPVRLGDLITKPTILTLNYFRCAGICTPLLNGVVEVINRTGAFPGKDFNLVTVSFDDRDTPEIAQQKRTNYIKQITRPFPPGAWRFLTADAATSKALCDAVGFKFKKQGSDFIHAGAIIFLSPQGRVTRYMYGVTFLPADVQMAVQEAARGQARPTINKWLKFCYSYDPSGDHYVLSFTRVGAIIVLLLAAVFAAFVVLKAPHRPSASAPREGA